ncbi:helix-turn-helix domain-containing protein [Streptomyces sp. NPDC005263]|uniref:helix-turn-helix domain-containing protein n=1 Tax=Streptomyces sp. NPDC005263 TaxID=3364711 RepID=UPI00369C1E8D
MAALFGSRVRRLRTAAGMTQEEVGQKTHVVSTRITQIERASGAKPTLELARALDAVLGADNLLVELWPYVYRETFPDWSRKFIAYSERAVVIQQYAAHVVAYTEGADYGQLIQEPAIVSRYKVIYDRLRAAALPPAHVPRHDPVRDGGRPPWHEHPVPN